MRLITLGTLAVLVGLLTPTATTATQPADASATCQVLQVSKALRTTLRRVHVRYLERGLDKPFTVRGPRGRVYNGRCGSTQYALASFSATIGGTFFGTQDQPERFRRKVGRRWRDLGDTGGDPCFTAPRALLELWKIECAR
jgi:hypothetical protein